MNKQEISAEYITKIEGVMRDFYDESKGTRGGALEEHMKKAIRRIDILIKHYDVKVATE